MKRGLGLLMALFVLGLAFGCGGEDPEPGEAGPPFCAKDNDCRSGAKCIGGLCYSSCTISDDCAEGATCWGGLCCLGVGDCDSPCGMNSYIITGPATYTGPGLYCEGDDVFYYETRGCGPCMQGGQCYGERRTACAAGTACRETGAALAECRAWEGAAACAQLQKVQQGYDCANEGLRVCEEYVVGDSCYRLECRAGKWANLDPAGLTCSTVTPADCDCALDLGFAGARADGDADSESDGDAESESELDSESEADSETYPLFCASDNDCRSGAKCIGSQCYSSCSKSDDCADGAGCWDGYCCLDLGSCDSPCGRNSYIITGPANYTGPGLYCEGDDVFYYETRGCGPCMQGGQCYGERRTACTVGTACRETGAALAECRAWEGAAACAQLQKVQSGQTCTTENLRVCEEYLVGDSCYRLECRAGKWANLDPAGLPCSSLTPADCDCALDLGFVGARTDGDVDSEGAEAEGEAVEGGRTKSKERK